MESAADEAVRYIRRIEKWVYILALFTLLTWLSLALWMFHIADTLKSWVLIDARNAVERMVEREQQKEGGRDGEENSSPAE